MKKTALCTILLLCVLLAAGCKRQKTELTVDDVTANTVLVGNDGTVQAAMVETFDKDYYSLSELKDFVSKEIGKYNTQAKEEAIAVKDIQIKDGNAVLILTFTSLEHYKNFNKVDAAFAKVPDAENTGISLPDTFIRVKDGAEETKENVMSNEKYRVLSIMGDTQVKVDGKIKYYSNGTLVDKSTIQASSDSSTIIVYKP